MDAEKSFSTAEAPNCQPDQTLSDLLQSMLEIQNANPHLLCERLQQLKNMYPDFVETTFNDVPLQQTSNLEHLQSSIDQFPDINLSERLQILLNTCNIRFAQDGGALNNSHGSTGNASTVTARSAVPVRPSTSNAAPPTGTSRLTQPNIDTLIRDGGEVNGYRILPRPCFNSVQLRRPLNLIEINSTDLVSYHIFLHNAFSEIVAFARDIGGDASVINMSLTGSSLSSPIQTILTDRNNYDVNLFTDQIERVLQSNEQILTDDAVAVEVDMAMNRQGGGRCKLTDLALDQVIKRKKMSLFSPMNISNKLCFSICLAHFLNPQAPENELERLAVSIHNDAGFSIQDKIGFGDLNSFESLLDIKIVVFYRTNAGALETYKNHNEAHPKMVCLYLHDDHYYRILNLTSFIGTSYVCEFCFKGYSNPRNHQCKHVCNVCFVADCYKHPKRNMHCPDCLRFCKSSYCYNAHIKTHLVWEKAPCDAIKYCRLCNKRYNVIGQGTRAQHKCSPNRCDHCGEDLHNHGLHRCFIQPIVPKEPNKNYIFYDFETRYQNGKHIANFVCAITFEGEKFVAEGPGCIAQLITHFRQPQYKGYCFIAHCAARFDSFLILEYFCKAGIALDVIMQGCKLIFMYDEAFAQRYIDSYAFIPMALSKMPAALNLTTTEKGYFPHLFNRVENENYIGHYPDKKFTTI
ncbi:uncharacterized protein LOC127508773 isoform X1 [Ctenopharyngodon idella]|uniref:uncharacterized protein LOC127508773 isoform X1 n=1 Tax=Ctenopharyngodon idella TaxID=7959 RepID=UPI002232B139|nr:uncharacterized protein LOC127508773 isoform X1 [Ctenopharyngodon idella]XP_051743102.1 uncharacterized protein LOC127508773 isoform X1 [Ctenopharyngodon idella]XP_051743103.1 uncharacterized protein LOC127508773 isoform X1 [Ctenopharyngodon idella]